MRHILVAATSAIAISALSSSPAIAQQKPADETPAATADDIVVTARRVSERQQDVPVAVTALQSAQIQRLGVQSPIDLRQAVAGLGVTSSAGRMSTPVYAIRGQRAGDTVMTQDAPVAIYQDEVLIAPPAGGNLGLFDLENVQVLKGPQGTLFGRNTTGGAVLFTSARPTDRLEGQVKVGYGNNQAWEGLAVLNVPLSDSLRVRGAVTYNKNNGFGTYYAGPAAGQHTSDRDEIAARLSIAFEPTPWLKTLTIGAYAKHIDHGTPFVLLGTPRPFGAADFVFNNPLNLPNLFPQGTLAAAQAAQRQHSPYDGATGLINPGNRYEVYSVTNTTTIELSDTLTFKNIFGYRKLKYSERNDYDGTVLPIIDAINGTHAENFTEEAQFQGKAFDNKLDYIAGIYFLHQSGDDGSGPNNGGLGIPGQMATLQFAQAPAYQVGALRNISFSGFGQVNYKLTDTLKATAGIRYTMDRRSIDVGSGALDAAGNLTVCNFTDSLGNPLPATFAACRQTNQRTFTSPSWQLGLDWKVDPATLVYITSRHSFRSGGFNLRGASNSAIAAYFSPESVTDIELGLKRDWELGADLRLRTNLAGYYQWYKNIQRNISVRNASGQIGNQTVNAAKAHIYGLEAELGLRAGSLL
ncbi:MAG TPA: TonB-dependent receptor, partial [Novosphingobium sp.]